MNARLLLPALLLCCSSAFAFDPAKLPARSPDESTTHTYTRRFSLPSALKSVDRIINTLDNYRVIVDELAKRLPAKDFAELKPPDWETRYHGFYNHPRAIKGTLLKQDYEIKKLEYELAVERSKHAKASGNEIDLKKRAMDNAEQAFLVFWKDFDISD